MKRNYKYSKYIGQTKTPGGVIFHYINPRETPDANGSRTVESIYHTDEQLKDMVKIG